MKPVPGRAIDGQTAKGASRPKGREALKKGVKTVRGFIRGVLWGSVLAASGLVVLSQMTPPQLPTSASLPGATVETDPQVPIVSPSEPADGAKTSAAPAEATTAATQTAPENAAPVTETSPVQPAPATAAQTDQPASQSVAEGQSQPNPAAEPQPGGATDTPSNVPPSVATGDLAVISPPVAPDTPQAPSTQTTSTPVVSAPEAPAQPTAQDAVVASPKAPAEPPKPPPSDLPQIVTITPEAAAPAVIATPSTENLPGASVPALPGAPKTELAPASAELPPPPTTADGEEALLTQPSQDVAPEVEPSAPVVSEAPETTVVTNRLPRIGDLAPRPEEETSAEVAEDGYDPATDDTLPPILRYARSFDNPDQKPLFAILLEDRGGEVNREELAALDLPLTIVIDPMADGAQDRAALWRAGRQEVVYSLNGLPEGATAADVEQTLQVLAEMLPETVGLIDPDGTLFQGNRLLATQIIDNLKRQGRGLVTFDQGLNSADQVARREDLASAVIFRRIDIDQATAPAVKRYLDRAVFRAAQEGEVAVIGELTPEIVEALLAWTIEGRAASVALAPITALMAR